jgi:AcrR family transcriptional regulator
MAATAPREEIKDTLLDTAETLFQRYGYKKTTVEDIAHEAGVSRATVYLHLKCKEEIALAWLDRHNRRLRSEMEAISGLPEPPICRLKRMLLARVLFRFDIAYPYSQSLDDLLEA